IQQDLRNSLYVLQRSIRMAGFDPSLGVRNNSPASLGIVGQFPPPHHSNGGSGPGTRIAAGGSCQSIAFTLDANGDQVDAGTGTLVVGAGTVEANDLEYVAFRLQDGALQKYHRNANGRADVDDDGDGFPDSDMLALVRYVRITLTAKKTSEVIAWGGSKPAHALSAIVQVRNHL
nr:hypothetical protein [Desulfobacterales bacterium]